MDLAIATGLPRPTAGRLLATLADTGLAERLPAGGPWILGRETARLGRAADPYRGFAIEAQPILGQLAEEVEESAMMTAVDFDGSEVLAQADRPRVVGARDWTGMLVPLHASASGKVFLAQLSKEDLERWIFGRALERLTPETVTDGRDLERLLARVRRHRYAETVDELEQGLAGIAVPVTRQGSGPTIVLGIAGPSSRFTGANRRKALPLLRESGERIRALLS